MRMRITVDFLSDDGVTVLSDQDASTADFATGGPVFGGDADDAAEEAAGIAACLAHELLTSS